MLKKSIISLLFLLSFVTIGQSNQKIESPKNEMAKRGPQKVRLSKLLELSKQQVEKGDSNSIATIETARKLADSLHMDNEKAVALNLLGIAWKIKGDNKTSVSYAYEALMIFQKLGNTSGCAEVYLNIGEAHRAGGNYVKSFSYLKTSLQLFEKCKDTAGLAHVYNRFAANCYEYFFNDTAVINKLFPVNNPTLSNFYKAHKSDSSFRRKYDATLKYLNLSDNFAKTKNLINVKISNQIILGALYTMCNLFDKALQVHQANLIEIKKTGTQIDEALALYNIGVLKIKKKDYNGALESGKESLRLAYLLGVKNYIMLSAGLISAALERMGNYKEANQYIRESYQRRIEMARADIEMKLQTMKQDFDMADKQNEINNRNMLLWILFISFIIIITITGIFIFILFNKNERKRLLNEELNRRNRIILQQIEELAGLNREKDKFFSILAHDLRNPMNVFLGFTNELVEELPGLSLEDIRRFAENMRKSAINLHRLLENLLQWSMMKQSMMPFNPEIVHLSEVVDEVISTIREYADNKHINLTISIPEDLMVLADKNMLQTIIRNLVSNAVKFTHNGGRINITANNAADNKVEISVQDTGIGISAEMLDKLFQLNQQLVRKGTDGEFSTGLGLILCKDFVEKHAGKIWVKSEEHKGSVFTFSLNKATE